MSDLQLERSLYGQRVGRTLVVFSGTEADERALETALELASFSRCSLRAVLLEGEFRGYSLSHRELERARAARHERFVSHAFRLCDRALEREVRLQLELVGGDGRGWLSGWLQESRFALVVIAHEHHAFSGYLPISLVARIRRTALCRVVVVK